jgi:Ca2+:H+ antiporter
VASQLLNDRATSDLSLWSDHLAVYYFLIFIPIALILDWQDAGPIWVFATSALAIVPLTSLIGRATENLSVRLGETIGGLLNATMGNVPELIIGIFALRKGLQDVVKASLTGSILGNVLFVLGLSLLAGGARLRTLNFNERIAGVNSKLLLVAVIGLVVPALFHFTSLAESRISLLIAVILFVSYLASLAFTLVTHKQLFTRKEPEGPMETGRKAWGMGQASAVLAISALALALMSESLTGAVEPTANKLGLTPIFAGVFLLATVGNISSLINAIHFARRNRMDLTLSVTLGSGTQVALLVAPVLVFAGRWIGQPMDLLFTRFEVVAVGISVMIARAITSDGESNWLEGLLLIAVYLMLGVGFYYMRT